MSNFTTNPQSGKDHVASTPSHQSNHYSGLRFTSRYWKASEELGADKSSKLYNDAPAYYVLLRIIDHAHGRLNACTASVSTLAAKTHFDPRTVRGAIERLKAGKFIEVTERSGRPKWITVNADHEELKPFTCTCRDCSTQDIDNNGVVVNPPQYCQGSDSGPPSKLSEPPSKLLEPPSILSVDHSLITNPKNKPYLRGDLYVVGGRDSEKNPDPMRECLNCGEPVNAIDNGEVFLCWTSCLQEQDASGNVVRLPQREPTVRQTRSRRKPISSYEAIIAKQRANNQNTA